MQACLINEGEILFSLHSSGIDLRFCSVKKDPVHCKDVFNKDVLFQGDFLP